MAFSKIAGLEVTPSTPSSSNLCNSPDVSSARRMLSYQIDCPKRLASCKRVIPIRPPRKVDRSTEPQTMRSDRSRDLAQCRDRSIHRNHSVVAAELLPL